MDEFKLRSIEEFDSDFAEESKASAGQKETAPVKATLIPEVNPGEETGKVEITTLYQAESMSDNPDMPLVINRFGEEEPEVSKPAKAKSGPGKIIAKIAVICALALTVAVFLLGCFVSVFLDNNGSDLKGYTFNTLASQTSLSNTTLKKGDLIIAKKVTGGGYQDGAYVAVPTALVKENGEQVKGCDIVVATGSVQVGDNLQITTRRPGDAFGAVATYASSATYGQVDRYIPGIGGIVSFAMDNAILVCALFLMLAALFICLLVLIDKVGGKKKSEDEPEEAPTVAIDLDNEEINE